MTLSMVIALAIVILMIVMIMSDKFAFGGPPPAGLRPDGGIRYFHCLRCFRRFY